MLNPEGNLAEPVPALAVERGRFGTPEQLAVLSQVEADVRALMARHIAQRNLWFPNELSPADADFSAEQEADLQSLREAAKHLPDTLRVGLALNLLTEEGLPHFHRLIAAHFGNESPWSTWNNLWTAEEDRHGCALRDYSRDARIFNMGALEKMQYAYIESGFNPEWQEDPYRLLAYTSLQERATQVAHSNTGRACAAYEPRLQRTLAHVAGDEARHYQFYRAVFAAILRTDPNQALQSLLHVMPALAMPGHTMPGYAQMAEVVNRAHIYGPVHYRDIVEELLAFWNIGAMTGLSAAGAQAQEKLMKIPARLNKLIAYAATKTQPRSFQFDFIYGRTISFA